MSEQQVDKHALVNGKRKYARIFVRRRGYTFGEFLGLPEERRKGFVAYIEDPKTKMGRWADTIFVDEAAVEGYAKEVGVKILRMEFIEI